MSSLDFSRRLEHVEAVVRAIEATIERRATEGHLELEIGGALGTRRIRELSMTELLKVRDQYLLELAKLRRVQAGKKLPRNVQLRWMV